MQDMKELQDKFILFAEKLGINSDIVEQIKEWFNKWTPEERKPTEITVIKKETMSEDDQEWEPVDISKPIENKEPSMEDVQKMPREELVVLLTKLMEKKKMWENKWFATWQQHSPLHVTVAKKMWGEY